MLVFFYRCYYFKPVRLAVDIKRRVSGEEIASDLRKPL